MAKLVLHTGAHKTGTSYLQRMMFFNRARLAQHGLHYPDLGPNPAHHILVAPWIDMPEIPPRFYGPGGPRGLWERFVSEYAQAPGTVFLSAEPFSRAALQSVDMAELARMLAPFDEVELIYVTRRQPELIQSIWLQVSKSAAPPDFRRFLRGALQNHQCSGLWVDHGRVYDHMLQGFAPEQITLMDYDHVRAQPGGILQVFLDHLGVPLAASDFEELGEEHANLSPDALATYIACRIAAPDRPDDRLTGQVIQALTHLPKGRNTAYTAGEYARVLETFAPLNAAFTERVAAHNPGFDCRIGTDLPQGMNWRDSVPNPVWARLAGSIFRGR